MLTVTDGNFGERQEVTNKDWGYYANLSIYDWAASLTRDKWFLDVGCGTGYGSRHVKNSGARVIALERDSAVVAKLAEQHPDIDFRRCDLDACRQTPMMKLRVYSSHI